MVLIAFRENFQQIAIKIDLDYFKIFIGCIFVSLCQWSHSSVIDLSCPKMFTIQQFNLLLSKPFFEEATQQLGTTFKIFCEPRIQRPNFSGVKKNFSYTEILPKRAWFEVILDVISNEHAIFTGIKV